MFCPGLGHARPFKTRCCLWCLCCGGCCSLQTAAVVVGIISSILAVVSFILYVIGQLYGWHFIAKASYEYNTENKFNESMYRVYYNFGTKLNTLCGNKRRRISFKHARIHRIRDDYRTLEFVKQLRGWFRTEPFSYERSPWTDREGEINREVRPWLMSFDDVPREVFLKAMQDAQQNIIQRKLQMDLYKIMYSSRKNESGGRGRRQAEGGEEGMFAGSPKCEKRALGPRVALDVKMNEAREKAIVSRTSGPSIVDSALDGMGIIASLVMMILGPLLVAGVMKNDPRLILPWLVWAGFFGIATVFIVLARLIIRRLNDGKSGAKNAFIPLFSLVCLLLWALAILIVRCYVCRIKKKRLFLVQCSGDALLIISDGRGETSAPYCCY